MKLCWHFTNIRVEAISDEQDKPAKMDILGAKYYFQELFQVTKYPVFLELLAKIEKLEINQSFNKKGQELFILAHRDYLDSIRNYTAYEFELLNSGRTNEEVKKEREILKKYGRNS